MPDFGWLSILPALTSLGLALITRRVLLSLASGVFLGAILLSGGNLFKGFLFLIEKEIFVQIADPFNAQILLLMILINGFVSLIRGSGAITAFGRSVSRSIKGPIRTQLAAWVGGLCIFFTDSGHSLILGPIFQPLFRQAKVCREKLAYILDSTSAPLCCLIPFIGWGIYSTSLIQSSFDSLGIKDNSFFTFIHAIPFQFYPILMLLAIPLFVVLRWDFPLMERFQSRFVSAPEAKTGDPEPDEGVRARVVLIPMLTLFATIAAGILYYWFSLGNLPGIKIRVTIMCAYLFATAVCVVLIRRDDKKTKLTPLYLSGLSGIFPVLGMIILAWALGDICGQVGTGRFISTVIGSDIPPFLFPAIVFLIGSVTSFATGTSWGTFGILMPIALPIAHEIGAPMLVTIGAVLSGGVWGDHCSPISDTAILASMASDCPHADHINTQIPYATAAGLATLLGFVIAGITPSYWVLLAGIFLLLPVMFLLVTLSKKIRWVGSSDHEKKGVYLAPGRDEGV
ncbi:MAG: hypothetical protein HYT76_08930 [Deltaproteobacteria bacterium]|nr:hypothetical protein [Deltaproteobacteria bacterium]